MSDSERRAADPTLPSSVSLGHEAACLRCTALPTQQCFRVFRSLLATALHVQRFLWQYFLLLFTFDMFSGNGWGEEFDGMMARISAHRCSISSRYSDRLLILTP